MSTDGDFIREGEAVLADITGALTEGNLFTKLPQALRLAAEVMETADVVRQNTLYGEETLEDFDRYSEAHKVFRQLIADAFEVDVQH